MMEAIQTWTKTMSDVFIAMETSMMYPIRSGLNVVVNVKGGAKRIVLVLRLTSEHIYVHCVKSNWVVLQKLPQLSDTHFS